MAESNNIFCEPCEHDRILIKATIWCNDCCKGFCEECIKGHKVTKILRAHHIITIKDHLETSDWNASQTCVQHSKPFDSFCPQHNELLCLKCIQLHHGKCGDLLRIDEAIKGVKISTALIDLEEQITTLLRNIGRGLELNTEHKNSNSDQKEAIKSTINDTRARINTKLDQLQEKLLDELETKYDKTVFDLDELKDRLHENEIKVLGLQTQLNGLKAHASDMQTFIGMKSVSTSVYSEKDDFDININKIHPDLQLCINSRTNSLIDDLKEFGEIILQNKCDYATYIEPQNRKAQLDVVKVFDITKVSLEKRHTLSLKKSKNVVNIQGCVMFNDEYTVFTDYSNERLIIHDKNGNYEGNIEVSKCPKYITIVDEDKVAVSYQSVTSHVDIINLTTTKTLSLSCNSYSWHNAVCFHDGTFFIAVVSKGIKELTRDGVLIKTFLSQVMDIGNIGVHDDHFYYSRTGGRTLYCTDLEGNPMWEFSDDRLYRSSYSSPFAIDGHGNVYVICYNSAVVLGISFDGKNHAVLLTKSDGLDKPSAIFCDQQNNRLLVCNEKNGKAFVFDLKN